MTELAPALERIHQLAGRLETPPHEQRLLAHHAEGIFKQPGLVFYGGRRRHCVLRTRIFRAGGELVARQAPPALAAITSRQAAGMAGSLPAHLRFELRHHQAIAAPMATSGSRLEFVGSAILNHHASTLWRLYSLAQYKTPSQCIVPAVSMLSHAHYSCSVYAVCHYKQNQASLTRQNSDYIQEVKSLMHECPSRNTKHVTRCTRRPEYPRRVGQSSSRLLIVELQQQARMT